MSTRVETGCHGAAAGKHSGAAWHDGLRRLCVAKEGAAGAALYRRYAKCFPPAYRERHAPELACEDLAAFETCRRDGLPVVTLVREPGGALRVRLIESGPPAVLSTTLALLEHLGLELRDHEATTIVPADGGAVSIQEFGVTACGLEAIDTVRATPLACALVRAVQLGECADDTFNRLCLTAGLAWREIDVLRAYARYLHQIQSPFPAATLVAALSAHPVHVRELVRLFALRFDPDEHADREARAAALQDAITVGLETVSSPEAERVLRAYLELIAATLRTNYYQRDETGRPKTWLAFKFDCARLGNLPQPRPRYEIFVSSPRVEGVHLRCGRVARGGLRWSDRHADYRTEILGLLKAQRVKNVVIVPDGAKGGFVLRRPPAGDREALVAEARACYRTFIRGLLDLTDNLVAGGTQALVPGTVCWDEPDPYLVVAADKGTASFSDLANEVAADYGFWLGDAFASGGSAGYDHKRMGITARGAFEAQKRHFRELGLDAGRDGFTAVGIGDMSGDVFGNGMLLAPGMKLVAAFDHRHVFIDPDPDPATSRAERQRLFALPHSSWADYDPAVLSAGGGVYPRNARSIALGPQARRVLGVDWERGTPEDVIAAILCAPVDLLWCGGIGTYVKAGDERHAEVGDRANDAVRVDGAALRCRVVAEGANLGLTQRGRIEYALGGGRLNTDAIDNAAGVDCSDHEVNIKILLAGVCASGVITRAGRDALLESMTGEVAALVLRDVYLQTQAISMTEAQAAERLDRHDRLLAALERAGQLDRRQTELPDAQALARRRAEGRGLTRPEIAVLLAYTKLSVNAALLASDLPDAPLLAADLARYFPAPLRERFAAEIARHPLRREIVATSLTNDLVNRVGSGFVNDLAERTGHDDVAVARAFVVARELFDLERVWREIEALDGGVAAELQTTLLLEVSQLVEQVTPWLLRHAGSLAAPAPIIARYRPALAAFAAALPATLAPAARTRYDLACAGYVERGVPAPVAARLAALPELAAALEVADLAMARGTDLAAAAGLHAELGARCGQQSLCTRSRRRARAARGRERQAWIALGEEVAAQQRELTGRVLERAGGIDPGAACEQWLSARSGAADRLRALLAEIETGGDFNLALAVCAAQAGRELAAGSSQ